MDKKERVEAFLKELSELTEKYDLEITTEGTSPLLFDILTREYVAEFGVGVFGGDYKAYNIE